MSEDGFARAADRLLNFAMSWQVDNEKEIIPDGTILIEGRKAINQVVKEGDDADRNFVRLTIMEETDITGFNTDGHWSVHDQRAFERFLSHWEPQKSIAPEATIYM